MDKTNTSKIINNVYFDEISNEVDMWLTTYLNFDNVNLKITKSDNNLIFLITYVGRGSHKYESGAHVSTIQNYSYSVSLFDATPRDNFSNAPYENVSISIHKSRLLNRRKIVIRNKPNNKIIVIHAKKVVLDSVTSDNVDPKTYKKVQEDNKKQKSYHKHPNLPYLILETSTVALVAFIMHKFLYGYATPVQTLFMYGVIGLFTYHTISNKIEVVLALMIAIALLAQMTYLFFLIGILIIYWNFIRDKNK